MSLYLRDAIVAPVWLGATLLLCWAAWRVGQQLFPHDGHASRLMHTIVLSWACIVGVATLLGSLGWLSPALLLAGVGAVAGLAWRRCRHIPGTSQPLETWPSADQAIEEDSLRFSYAWLMLWGLVLALAVSHIIWRGLLRFPDDWDTLNYHLPLIVQWLHRGNLYVPEDAAWPVPGNNELLGFWLVGPFSGDFLISWINLPSVLLLAVGTVELAWNLGLARPWRNLTTLAVLASWPVLRHLSDAENDVAAAGLFMTVLAYSLRYARKDRQTDLALAAVSLGLLTGVKYYALGYAWVAGLGLVLLVLATRGRRAAVKVGLVLSLGVGLWGGYWYVRNLCLTGSPIYPQGIWPANDHLRQVRLSTGQTPVWQTTLLGSGRPEVFPLLHQAIWRFTGPCHAAACFLLPILVAWLLGSGMWLRYYAKSRGLPRFTLAFWVLAAGVIWSVTPFTVEVAGGTLDSLRRGMAPIRYGLCFLSLSVVCLALLFQDLIRGFRRFLRFVLPHTRLEATTGEPSARHFTLAALDSIFVYLLLGAATGAVVYQTTLLAQHYLREDLLDLLLLATNLWLAGLTAVCIWQSFPHWRRMLTAVLTPGVLAAWVIGVAALSHNWHTGFAAHYDSLPGWRNVSRILRMNPATARICTLTYRYYPLFGSRRQFQVCRPYWLPSYEALLTYLRDHDVSLVIAQLNDPSALRRYSGKCDWLREHPDLFLPLQNGSQYFICRVDQESLSSTLTPR
jgi:hypothetical protein